MYRALLVATLGSGCAHGVSRPNPPAPPLRRDVPYKGRVVVSTGALREQADQLESTWTRRLQILGVTAHITYDDDRAVFDVYGVAPDPLARIAAILVDPGGWNLDGNALDASLVAWLPPSPSCHCSGRVRVAIDQRLLCKMFDGDHELSRPGARTPLPGKIRWKARSFGKEIDVEHPDLSSGCPTDAVWPDSIVFALPVTAPLDAQTAIVLGLAGGSLPEAARIDAVTPAGGEP